MIASVYAFFLKDNKILLLRRVNTGYEDGKYGLPAGHVENNESLVSGLLREVREEVGIDLNPLNVELVHVMHRWGKDDIRLDFFFKVNKWDNKPKNAEPNKCDDLSWFSINNLPENIMPFVVQAVKNMQDIKIYSEFGW